MVIGVILTMIRLNITESMLNFIKDNRDKYNMKASVLAEKIDKSSAYISKLDKGDYKTISYEDLYFMLGKICGDETNGKMLVDDFLTNYIIDVNDDQLLEDYGLMTYDDVLRMIEVPSDLIDYINEEISNNNLDIIDIISKANENNDLPNFAKNPKYDYNVYYFNEKDEMQKSESNLSFIKIHLLDTVVLEILKKENPKSNYLTIQALLYTIYRQQDYDETLSSIMAENFLSKFHFFNLVGMRRAKFAAESKTKAFKEMDNMPTLFVSTLCNFANVTFSFFEKNPGYTISKISGFHHNLFEEASFVMAILDLPLYKLKDINIEDKRNFLKEVEQLITKNSKKKPGDIQII